MGIFDRIFGNKKLKVTDTDFGEIESFSIHGENIVWEIKKQFLGADIEILIDGDKNGIYIEQKKILLNALNQETTIKSECENALREQFQNAELDFHSLEKHFILRSISVRDEGFEITFEEKDGQNYFFNVHFENNRQVGVSIDG